MTMVPSENFFNHQQQQFYDGYGGFGDSYTGRVGFMRGYEYYCSDTCLASDLVVVGPPLMAEEESRTSSVNEEAGSSSKDFQEDKDERWLQLGLGTNPPHLHEPIPPRSGLLELDLLPAGGTTSQHLKPLLPPPFHLTQDFRPPRPPPPSPLTTTPMFLEHPRTSNLSFPQHEIPWGYRPHHSWSAAHPAAAASSSSSSMTLGPYYHPRPLFQHQGIGVAGPSSTVRVIDPPRRLHSNIWFILQASQNQAKEPFLPQIPKSYLRIKDGRMTVRVLMKYLVNKLRLDSESEIEITCRGQQLVPFFTLQHVRDTIWNNRRDFVTLLSDSSTTDHIMILHYGRRDAT